MREGLYGDIIEALPQALLVLDQGLRVLVSNRACDLLLLKTKGELVGQELAEIIPHKGLCNQAQAVLVNGGTKVVEFYLEIKEGISKVLRVVVTGLEEDKAGLSKRLCLIALEDVGEQVRLEEQLVQSEKLAGMGLLASSVAHELGNPLAIMTSTLQYVRDGLLNTGNGAVTESIEAIMSSVGQMHELLRSLSQFTGPQRPRFEPTDLSPVLSQMLGFICAEAEQHHIRIYHQFQDNLPSCLVNPGEIKQLLLNLFKNAIEAMPDGGELRVKVGFIPKASPEAEDQIRIDVSDTGIGMSEAEMRRIFRTFYSTKPGNTGLGLPFCRRVAEEHGGEITADSRPGEGSTFVVTLPARRGEEV